MNSNNQSNQFAALDLGSNSFHLVVASLGEGRVHVIDKLKDMVRLAAGLDANNHITPDAMTRALDCLARFGERLKGIPPTQIRIVGTNTLRGAENSSEFIDKAQALLGHEIEIIAGREEARLIFMGVCYSHQSSDQQRLVVDIGGGSTELIIGPPFRPQLMESLEMGCISLTDRFFASGALKESAFNAAILAARQELEPLAKGFRDAGWQSAIGASGTILAINEIGQQNGWNQDNIQPGTLHKLRSALLAAEDLKKVKLPGLSPNRVATIAGGLAVLSGIFHELRIKEMEVSQGALREGLLYDLIGRVAHEDVRDHSIQDLVRRYQVDQAQAERVANTAALLFIQVQTDWMLQNPLYAQLLEWAARTHEIGLDIAHNQYHRHGDYLLQHMDLPGFSRGDQRRLALLVRAHRRKFPTADFNWLPDAERLPLMRLALLLRLAVLLQRARTDEPLPVLQLRAEAKSLYLQIPDAWLAAHPLAKLDLAQEIAYLTDAPLTLVIGH